MPKSEIKIKGLQRVPLTRSILLEREEQTLATLIACFEKRYEAEHLAHGGLYDSWAMYCRTGMYRGRRPDPVLFRLPPPPPPEPRPVKLPPLRYAHKKKPLFRPLAPQLIEHISLTNTEAGQATVGGILDLIKKQWEWEGKPRYMHLPARAIAKLDQELREEYKFLAKANPHRETVWDTEKMKFSLRPYRWPMLSANYLEIPPPLPAKICPKCGAEHYRPEAECGKWHPQ